MTRGELISMRARAGAQYIDATRAASMIQSPTKREAAERVAWEARVVHGALIEAEQAVDVAFDVLEHG